MQVKGHLGQLEHKMLNAMGSMGSPWTAQKVRAEASCDAEFCGLCGPSW